MSESTTTSDPLANSGDQASQIDQQIHALVQAVAQARQLPVAAPWASTSVLICAPGQNWSDSPDSGAYSSSGVTWVVTEHVEQLSWCFLQLQNILTPRLDYIGAQDVYSHLADAAIEFLGRHTAGELNFQPETRAKALLLFVLQCARRLVGNHS